MKKTALKGGIQSIGIGFSILEILSKSSIPISLTKISELSGFSPSKIHSYMVSFTNLKMVVQDPSTGFYGLGPKSLELGLAYLDQNNLINTTRPLLEELADQLGLTIFLGVWGNKGPTIVYRVDGINTQSVFDLRIGSVLPLLSSAVGLNFCAHLPFSLVKEKIEWELKNTSGLPFKNIEAVEKELLSIRKNGVSCLGGILLTDFTAISAPIFDFSKTINSALTIMGRTNQLDDSLKGEPVKLLKEVVRKISTSKGYQSVP